MRMVGLSIVILALAAMPGAGPLRAEQDVFFVSGIAVDQAADSATQAREAALADGHRMGLRALFEKLVPLSEQAALPDLPLDQIYPLVVDFAVANERSSDVRYLADLAFRFKGPQVRALLRRSGISFAVTQSKPVLIVPVYSDGTEARLWQDNPWFGAWANYRLDAGLVPLTVPLGDLGDLAALDADLALAGAQAPLESLALRYDTVGTLVTHAELTGDPEAGTASLLLTSFEPAKPAQGRLEQNLLQEPGEDLAGFLTRVAATLDQQIQEQWKQSNLLDVGNRRAIQVRVNSSNLADWLEVKRRLAAVASVDSVRVASLSRTGSLVDLGFVGNEQQLTVALAQQDLVLSLNIYSEWELFLRGDQNFDTGLPRSGTGPAPTLPSSQIAPDPAVGGTAGSAGADGAEWHVSPAPVIIGGGTQSDAPPADGSAIVQ